jgi:hypothetical protein
MVKINSLIFNDIELENDFRKLLSVRFTEDDVIDLYDREINFIPMDSDLKNEVELPVVTFSLFQGRSLYKDDEQIQRYTPFTVEVNVYTSGDSKVLKNKQLCNIIIATLQSNGPLQNYYCRGLQIEENTEVTSFLESTYRRVIRMSGLCDNNLKQIKTT